MKEFSYNEKLGLGLFLSEIKKMGALDKYMENYMKFHGLSSPSLIPRHIHEDMLASIFGYFKPLVESDHDPFWWARLFSDNFANYFVSFSWDETPQGSDFWGDMSVRLKIIIERKYGNK